jgi:hypothetical protein
MNPPKEIDSWRQLLEELQWEAQRVASVESYEKPTVYAPAEESDLRNAEERLGLEFPPSLRQFYLHSNGLSAVGWELGAIYPVSQIDYLRNVESSAMSCAESVEQDDRPYRKDPHGSRKRAHVYEQGTRVRRSLALASSEDDGIIVMLDPEEQSTDGEWACGQWWHGVASWDYRTFYDYLLGRLKFLRERR